MRTVRGMRDFMGPEILIRDYLIETSVNVFQLFGYQPLDTPVIELWETLSAKGGAEIEVPGYRSSRVGPVIFFVHPEPDGDLDPVVSQLDVGGLEMELEIILGLGPVICTRTTSEVVTGRMIGGERVPL